MELWRVCRTVLADLNHFDEDPDPDPHLSDEKSKCLHQYSH